MIDADTVIQYLISYIDTTSMVMVLVYRMVTHVDTGM